ncbi:MAG: hypothetical protein EDM75_08720 [Chlorobiota bacterium]|nr:MAG: hypothetical protein EDM75_08720 [Chlorobiota bacterium]
MAMITLGTTVFPISCPSVIAYITYPGLNSDLGEKPLSQPEKTKTGSKISSDANTLRIAEKVLN